MGWASHKALSWRLSNTLDASFRSEALEEAIASYGCPEIFNSGQAAGSPRMISRTSFPPTI